MTDFFDEVQDSGERTQWDTGSQRDAQEGKGRWDLIPFLPMERLAQHFENGAKKYDDDNWKKGQNLRQYVNSAMRHLFKMAEGWTDEDHAAAVMWNAAAFIWTKDAIDKGLLPAELDDIPWREEPLESEPGEFRIWQFPNVEIQVDADNISPETIRLLTGLAFPSGDQSMTIEVQEEREGPVRKVVDTRPHLDRDVAEAVDRIKKRETITPEEDAQRVQTAADIVGEGIEQTGLGVQLDGALGEIRIPHADGTATVISRDGMSTEWPSLSTGEGLEKPRRRWGFRRNK